MNIAYITALMLLRKEVNREIDRAQVNEPPKAEPLDNAIAVVIAHRKAME